MNTDMYVLWVTDPWHSLDHTNDSTLRLIEEAFRAGFQTYWCDYKTIVFKNGVVLLETCKVVKVEAQRRSDDFIFSEALMLSISNFDIIHFRVDPPINNAYRYPLQLLHMGIYLLRKQRQTKYPLILNPPQQILLESEKLMQSIFKQHFPKTIVSSQWDQIYNFGSEEKKTVLKPIGGTQSIGVEVMEWNTGNQINANKKKLKTLTNAFTVPVLLQTYLKGIEKEEIRMWFVNGRLITSIRKIPKNNFIFNIDRGDILEPVKLDKVQMSIAKILTKHLREKSIFTAAIDLIDNKITDYNITSPGLIVQIEKISGINIAKIIIEAHNSLPR